MGFKEFKNNQKKLSEAINKMKNQGNQNSYVDERFWNGNKDSSGNGVATIRFLPQKNFDASPIILTYRHGFQLNGKWFIEPCPVTIGEKCPVCEHSQSIWSSNENLARDLWRKKTYIANILVIEDPANPENNGTVKLFKFGKGLYDNIMSIVAPEDEDEEGVNVFDFDEGLNFKWKLVQKGGYNNYDKSKFIMNPNSIGNGDESIQEQIYNKIFDFEEFVNPKGYKSYDDLLKKFREVMNKPSINAPKTHEENLNTAKKQEKTIESEDETVNEEDDDFDFDSLLNDEDDSTTTEDDIPF